MIDSAPSECPECGSTEFEPLSDESDDVACADCGLVLEGHTVDCETDFDPASCANLQTSGEQFSSERLSDEESFSMWNHDPAIFALINADDTHQEFYRITNPDEFFAGLQREREMKNKIQESELQPFQTVDLPYID